MARLRIRKEEIIVDLLKFAKVVYNLKVGKVARLYELLEGSSKTLKLKWSGRYVCVRV